MVPAGVMVPFDEKYKQCVFGPAYLLLVLIYCQTCACSQLSTEPESPSMDGGNRSSRFDGGVDGRNRSSQSDSGASGDADYGSDAGFADPAETGPSVRIELASAPLIFATTKSGFHVNVVVLQGDPRELEVQVSGAEETQWTVSTRRTIKDPDVVEWRVESLQPSTEYRYRVVQRTSDDAVIVLYTDSVTTQRTPGDEFVFCMLADTHVFVDDPAITGDIVSQVAQQIETQAPDFVIHLGDVLDFHNFGFNDPTPDKKWTREGYLAYRKLMGTLLGQVTHYSVIGNWDGENGDFTAEQIELARTQRLLYLPGPTPSTYPEGGSRYRDYFAFTWGDALFVLLNVMSYTKEGHYLSGDIGVPDDWTLGEEQLDWLEQTLKNNDSRYKLLFIHHVVGGAAGDEANSAYGRGGGQAAFVGEQVVVHGLMRQYGVQALFYGHDHVFYDMVVEGIHYTLPGSAGAPWKFESYETGYPEGEYWTDSGYARVTVKPNRIDVDFINLDDEILYNYSID